MKVHEPAAKTSVETIRRFGELADRRGFPERAAQAWTDARFNDDTTARWLQPFLENTVALVAPADDPLALRDDVWPGELADRTWLLREPGSRTRLFNEAFLARHELRPRILTLGSNGAIAEGVRAGLGVSVVSRITVALELDAELLCTLPVAGLPERRWYAHRSAVGPARPSVAAWLAYVSSVDARNALLAARRALPDVAGAQADP